MTFRNKIFDMSAKLFSSGLSQEERWNREMSILNETLIQISSDQSHDDDFKAAMIAKELLVVACGRRAGLHSYLGLKEAVEEYLGKRGLDAFVLVENAKMTLSEVIDGSHNTNFVKRYLLQKLSTL